MTEGVFPANRDLGLPPATRRGIINRPRHKGKPETGMYASDINAPQPIIRFPVSL
jgi:hypothetical protein